MDKKPNSEQIQNLMKELNKSTGISGKDIHSAEKGQLDGIMSKLNPTQAEQLKKVLTDRQSAEKLFSSPQAQELLKKFMNNDKK